MELFRSPGLTTLNATFMSAAEAVPDKVYLEFSGDAYSYARMATEVEKLARGLHSLGVQRGDRVLTLLETGPDSIIAWFAVNRLGAIHVPINTAYMGDFLRHQINDAGARIVICENHFVDRVTQLAPQLTSVEHILHLGAEADAGPWKAGFAPLDEYRLTTGEAPYVDVDPADLAAIIYTSGTTGLSKGCMASHNYFSDLPQRYGVNIGRTPEDIHWSCLPLFHIGGICQTVCAMQLKATASVYRKFSVSRFWPEIERTGANVIMLMGSMAQMIANEPETEVERRCFGQIRNMVAVPMAPALAQVWRERFGLKNVTGLAYGSTEAGLAASADFEDPTVPPGSCGRSNESFEVKIVNDLDEEVPPNTVGEVVVRPKRPHVMFSGYWNNPEATMSSWRNMWHHMGDQARMDENGNIFFADRSKDVIRRRGENISSFEMEMTFVRHPDISEVAIHAVRSEVTEDDVKATIVLKPGAAVTEAEILDWARPHVPHFAMPRFIEFRDDLPKNPSLRVLKFQLREEGVVGSPGTELEFAL